MSLSEKTVDALLDKLASDDAFRDTFQSDPRKALASLGDPDAADAGVADGAWMCMRVSQLASKEAFKRTREALRRQLLSSQAGQSPISLEASKS